MGPSSFQGLAILIASFRQLGHQIETVDEQDEILADLGGFYFFGNLSRLE